MDSAPTAGPEERSCCRSVLLMNYDTKRFEEVPGERNSPDQVHLSLWNHRRRNGQFTPFIFYSLVCHAVKEKNHLLWGQLIVKYSQQSKHFLSVD